MNSDNIVTMTINDSVNKIGNILQKSVDRHQNSFFKKLYSFNSSFGSSAILRGEINSLNIQIIEKNEEVGRILNDKKTMESKMIELKNQNEEFKILISQMKTIETQN